MNLNAPYSPAPRIAFLLQTLEVGGAERVIIRLAGGFADLGYQVDLVLVWAKGALLPEVPSNVRMIDLDSSSIYASFPALVGYLRREKPTALISALELTNLLVLLARRIILGHTRIVVQLTTTMSKHKRTLIKKKIERLMVSHIYPWADCIVASSHGVADDFLRYTGVSPKRVRTIYNPVITDAILEQAVQPVEHSFFKPGQPPVIVAFGRLTAAKDYPTLLRAYARVRKTHTARLVIIGDGEQRPVLEDLTRELGIAEDVHLPGYVQNPFAYLKRAAVFVLSSAWEGLPSVLIEALACGCPIVSTDCPNGPSEILDGGRYGHLVPVGDVEAMASTILRVLAGETRQAATTAWLDQFRVENVLEQYLEILDVTNTKADQ
jgi:glycosyltransferase involved in cell wall biosynthesis